MVSSVRRLGRWTRRDLRRHWVAITVVALVIAIGTGLFAGLGSTGEWRRESNDASFAALDMHDLRVVLSPGTFVTEGRMATIARSIDGTALIENANERLTFSSQVDASTAVETVLVPGRVVGLDPTNGPDRLWVKEGASPAGDVAALEVKFANTFDLPSSGVVQIAGGQRLEYAGLGALPTDFYVTGERGDLLAQFNFAVLYTTLERAQELAGPPRRRQRPCDHLGRRRQPVSDPSRTRKRVRVGGWGERDRNEPR